MIALTVVCMWLGKLGLPVCVCYLFICCVSGLRVVLLVGTYTYCVCCLRFCGFLCTCVVVCVRILVNVGLLFDLLLFCCLVGCFLVGWAL